MFRLKSRRVGPRCAVAFDVVDAAGPSVYDLIKPSALTGTERAIRRLEALRFDDPAVAEEARFRAWRRFREDP